MKQLYEYFNDYLEYMNKNYKSRADWYNRCKSDIDFYTIEMIKYSTSTAFLKAVRLQKRIEKVEEMPETTNKEKANKAKYLWSISCNYKDLLYKDLIAKYLSDETIAYCVDNGLIKSLVGIDKERISIGTSNDKNEIYFDNSSYKYMLDRFLI